MLPLKHFSALSTCLAVLASCLNFVISLNRKTKLWLSSLLRWLLRTDYAQKSTIPKQALFSDVYQKNYKYFRLTQKIYLINVQSWSPNIGIKMNLNNKVLTTLEVNIFTILHTRFILFLHLAFNHFLYRIILKKLYIRIY